MEHIFIGALALALIGFLTIGISAWYAFHASVLWGWFVVPVFAAPPLSTLQCFGIILAIGLFNPKLITPKADPERLWSSMGGCLLAPPITLAIGYGLKNWFM